MAPDSISAEILSLDDLASLLGVHRRTVLRWRRRKRRPLPCYRVSRRCYTTRTDLLEWLRSQAESPPPRCLRALRRGKEGGR
jgi:hypothetical protein